MTLVRFSFAAMGCHFSLVRSSSTLSFPFLLFHVLLAVNLYDKGAIGWRIWSSNRRLTRTGVMTGGGRVMVCAVIDIHAALNGSISVPGGAQYPHRECSSMDVSPSSHWFSFIIH